MVNARAIVLFSAETTRLKLLRAEILVMTYSTKLRLLGTSRWRLDLIDSRRLYSVLGASDATAVEETVSSVSLELGGLLVLLTNGVPPLNKLLVVDFTAAVGVEALHGCIEGRL